jgi:hypothetical protein
MTRPICLDRAINYLNLVHDSSDAINAAHGFLRQLRVKETIQATSKHENAVVVLAENFSQGWMRACTEASFSNFGNFKTRDILVHQDRHKETTTLD